jgi:hypothetical protein
MKNWDRWDQGRGDVDVECGRPLELSEKRVNLWALALGNDVDRRGFLTAGRVG